MHLKTLTVRGFKSFATATTFRLEPGITCVVGPNGSGKSNVVDAIAWVLGEQGAKALRGGSMSDVIFAGTPNRPALGRAEVTLTIDNTDGALPVEFSEVSISRLMFRSGESEYSINGTPCRLLDVQELMSDSGIGRELHVIVGQGQLDAVLQARPEDRRAFVEEAAGVLKHRKRKEKALRKLDAMGANMARVIDLTAELRRQLGPLGRQAEIARRAGVIQAVVRDARLRLLADDLVDLRNAHAAETADEEAALAELAAVETQIAQARDRETELDAAVAAAAPALARAQETYYRLSGLAERARSLAQLAAERARHLAAPIETAAGRDPAALHAEAHDVREAQQVTERALASDRERLEGAVHRRQDAETAVAQIDAAIAAAARAAADRREGLARLAGEVAAAESRIVAGEAEIGRLAQALGAAREREAAANEDLARVQASAGQLDEGELSLDEAYEKAASQLADIEAQVAALAEQERAAERDRAAATARWEALALALDRRDGAGALLGSDLPGVLGSVAALLTVEAGAQAAIAAALGAYAEAVAVASVEDAVGALEELKRTESGRVGLVIGGASGPAPRGDAPIGRWALDLIVAPPALRPAIAIALDGIVVVADLAQARSAVARGVRAVTLEGDLFGDGWASGGSAAAPSLLEVQAAADEARDRAEEAGRMAASASAQLEVLREREQEARVALDEALEALHSSDARMAALSEELGLLASKARSAADEAARLERQRTEARAAHDAAVVAAEGLRERLDQAENLPEEYIAPDPSERDALAAGLAEARAAEVEARLGVRTGEERVRALTGRAEQLERAAAAEIEARARFAAEQRRRAIQGARARAVCAASEQLAEAIGAALVEAAVARDAAAASRATAERELHERREAMRALAERSALLRDKAHRDEVARAEQRLRVEALEERALAEFGIESAELVASYGPDQLVPPDPVPGEEAGTVEPPAGADGDGETAGGVPYDRVVQQKRAKEAERQLTQLGKVNPLALEEFAALEERHQFLSTQLEDLKATRRDLLGIVREVDGHIHEIFRAAFEDTAREFTEVFEILFPGGSGRLELTDPENLMETGIEVIVRPAGKKVSRLSLLSGGERSLAAIALLVSIFRARPSPFYVLDEVEAALDDRNLQRLLQCLEGLRERSQLIIITHQKRTMEIADSLYGVSMRDDGVSAVVSQRLREVVEV